MKLATTHSYIFAIIPFLIIMLTAYMLDMLPNSNSYVKALNVIAEKDLDKMLERAGLIKQLSKTKYQILRVVSSIAIGTMLFVTMNKTKATTYLIIIVYVLVVYKAFYIILLINEKNRIDKLNKELPYLIKTIVFLCHLYPVTNSLDKARTYAPAVFKADLDQLLEDIDAEPMSFAPYQKWIDRYEGKLKMLDYYLKTLYRMKESASMEQTKMLENLNKTVSADVTRARKAKNATINETISYIGLMPSGYLVVALMITFVSVLSTSFIF